jgi:hypothetical protein
MTSDGYVVSGLIAVVSGLLWRKLDAVDKRMEKVDDKLNNLTGDFREFKGKVEALLGVEKKHPEPVEAVKAS